MSVTDQLLALLHDRPRSAAQLQRDLTALTDADWPRDLTRITHLLSLLEEDGKLTSRDRPARYSMTGRGRATLATWWEEPVAFTAAERDELVFKVALASARGHDDLIRLLDTQQRFILAELHALTDVSRTLPAARIPSRLRCERRMFDLEAESRWLTRVEALASPPPSGKEPRHASPPSP